MKKFNIYDFLYITNNKFLNEAEEEEVVGQQQQQAPVEQTPQEVSQTQQKTANPQSQAFRSLQGQMIANVSFTPNGTDGGVIKIQVKNSYVPFVISWTNSTVTTTDLKGQTVVLTDDQQ